MQIRRICLALAAGSLLALSVAGLANDRKDIDAVFAKVSKAVMNKDIKTIQAAGTPDFTYTEGGQTIDAATSAQMMEQQFAAVKGNPKCRMKVTSCVIKDKEADVKFEDNTEMTAPGQDGKLHKMAESSKATGVLVKTDSGWLMKSITVISSKMTMDGKPFTPAGAPPTPPSK